MRINYPRSSVPVRAFGPIIVGRSVITVRVIIIHQFIRSVNTDCVLIIHMSSVSRRLKRYCCIRNNYSPVYTEH